MSSLRIGDVKMLWARSGNRCSMPTCQMELTAGGTSSLLGEIAHIIARKQDGPRGAEDLPIDKRDEYDNLIILCPTDHRRVDDSPEEWSVEKLKRIKAEHELWVTTQLSENGIKIDNLDGLVFIANRISEFKKNSDSRLWLHTSLTPLIMSDETINPLNQAFVDAIHNTRLPELHVVNEIPNIHYTRPNRFGVENEDLRELGKGIGHRIEIHRSGHTEISICLEYMGEYISSLYRNRPQFSLDSKRIIHYNNLAEILVHETSFLSQIWSALLPFFNMVMSVTLTCTESTALIYDPRHRSAPRIGKTVRHPHFDTSRVFERGVSSDELLHFGLQRIVESYGWILPILRESDGELALPKSLVG